LRPFFRDRDGVFDVHRGLPVHGDDRPTVLQGLRVVRAHVEHRLDGEDVAGFDLNALARRAVVWNLRVFVHAPADAVPDVLAHDRIAVRFGVRLHRPADVAQVPSGPALFDRALQTLLGGGD